MVFLEHPNIIRCNKFDQLVFSDQLRLVNS